MKFTLCDLFYYLLAFVSDGCLKIVPNIEDSFGSAQRRCLVDYATVLETDTLYVQALLSKMAHDMDITKLYTSQPSQINAGSDCYVAEQQPRYDVFSTTGTNHDLTCSWFVAKQYCANGDYGTGWNHTLGDFSDFPSPTTGLAADEACCDCGKSPTCVVCWLLSQSLLMWILSHRWHS